MTVAFQSTIFLEVQWPLSRWRRPPTVGSAHTMLRAMRRRWRYLRHDKKDIVQITDDRILHISDNDWLSTGGDNYRTCALELFDRGIQIPHPKGVFRRTWIQNARPHWSALNTLNLQEL